MCQRRKSFYRQAALTSALTSLHSSGLSEMTLLIPHLAHSRISSRPLTVQQQIHFPAALHSALNLAPSGEDRAA